MPEPLFSVRKLSKRFSDGTEALKDINLDIFEGECLVIAGSNGSGKTLLMRLVMDLIEPTSGSVTYRGLAGHARLGTLRREVGLVFQDADAQVVGETVAEDVAFGPRNLGFSREETERRVCESLAQVGLADSLDLSPRKLSGGEKRRLAVAGILAMGCRTVIMDEPFANLDWPGVVSVLSILRKLKTEGCTVVVLTHELEKVLAHADRLVILDRGSVRASGKPGAVLDRGVSSWGIRDPRHRYEKVEDCTWLE